MLARLEDNLGETELASRHRRIADKIYKKTEEVFWDDEKKMFADDREHTFFIEHTQCIATLSDHAQDKVKDMMKALADPQPPVHIYRTTIYYSFYLFEACKKAGCFEVFDEKINFWSDLTKQGFKTTPECPEPARSDCHAWGAHPLYHLQTGILGVSPYSPCFKTVQIKPNLLNLDKVEGCVPHKLGDIKVSLFKENDIIKGTVILPEGLTGIFFNNQEVIPLFSGENEL